MNSAPTTHQSKKIRTLLRTGAALLVAGILLSWAAEPLSRVYLSRDAHGSFSTVDENRRDGIQNIADKLSWLGVGLLVVSAIGWVNRPEDQQEADK